MARKAERDHTCLKISVAQVSLPFPRLASIHGYRGSLSSSSGAQGSVKKEWLMLVWLLQQANQQALGWLCIG